ncbi:hypothetical protein [Novosphingobium sp. CECT 9465]|uniref:hypothetical protein n=1 Tax=Novosphingobium sp. CECT 9465 TaxID=2829794 RepID=UPI001E3DB3FE|nr:hypothetical protein [Novosphingobium sp. CECT 9465]CAH0496616.1 hypothetical protein NVSP9465_01653 [Novosphingobium sp. CECT 9465]
MAGGPQKADVNGNFFQTPRAVIDSVAWKHLSFRARAVLQVFQDRHDGYNNGHLGLGIHAIGARLGNKNHGPNAKAVAELIQHGFLECVSDADRQHAKVREYRLTFVSTGKPRNIEKATNDYRDWRPAAGKTRKFGGVRTTTQDPLSGVETTTMVKNSVVVFTTDDAASPEFCTPCVGVNTTLLIDNQYGAGSSGSESLPSQGEKLRRADLRLELTELRRWSRTIIDMVGYGGARRLAHNAQIPEAALSRFRAGRSLPDHYRIPLQEACGRMLPFNQLEAACLELSADALVPAQ